MRSCKVEIDKIEGTEWPPDYINHAGMNNSLFSIYKSAGFELKIIRDQNNVKLPPTGGTFDRATLHEYMTRYRKTDATGWRAHILIVPRIEYPSGIWISKPLGLMYDFRSDDLNSLPREGCAIAHDKVGDSPLQYMRTLAHELGHVFNLAHPKHENPPQPIDESLMNQTMDLQALGEYPDNITYKFSDANKDWLCRGPSDYVRPGGQPFAERPEDQLALVSDIDIPLKDNLKFTISTRKESYLIGEPIEIRMSLRNEGDTSIHVVGDFSCYTGVVTITTISPMNRSSIFRPCYSECKDLSFIELKKGAELLNNIPIFFGANGHVFVSSGRYKIMAHYTTNNNGVQTSAISNIHEIEIQSPQSDADLDLSDLLMNPSQALFMIIRGGQHLEPAIKNLKKAVQNFPSHSATQMAKLSLASHLLSQRKTKTDLTNAAELVDGIPDEEFDYEQKAEKFSLLASINQALGYKDKVSDYRSRFKEIATRCCAVSEKPVSDMKERVNHVLMK